MYEFKRWPELVRAIAIGAVVALLSSLVLFDAETVITDWRPWALGMLTGVVQASAAAGLAIMTQPKPEPEGGDD